MQQNSIKCVNSTKYTTKRNKYDRLADICSFPTGIYNFVVALFSFNS